VVATSVDGLVRTVSRIYAERGLTIQADIDSSHVVRVQREDLDEMIGNLLDNACKWARQQVRVSVTSAGDAVLVMVDDDGSGVPVEQRADVLKRGVPDQNEIFFEPTKQWLQFNVFSIAADDFAVVVQDVTERRQTILELRESEARFKALPGRVFEGTVDYLYPMLDAQTRTVLQEQLLRLWEEQRKTVLYITHSIEEAIYMADRIFVMSKPPAKIVATLKVTLPRPRNRKSEEFYHFVDKVYSLIT